MEVFLIVLGIASAIGAIILVSYWLDRKRGEELRQVAEDLGLAFHPEGSSDLTAQFGPVRTFQSGSGTKAEQADSGCVGRRDDFHF